MPRSIRPLLTICAIALLAPAGASAQTPAPTLIDGSPLNIWTDGDGSVQANVDGYPASEWYPPCCGSDENGNTLPSPVANAGFGLVVDPDSGNPLIFGRFISGTLGTPTSGPTLSPGNPAAITTTWTLTDSRQSPETNLIELTQVLTYTNGSRQFDAAYGVKNVSGGPLQFRATMAGDLAIRGSDAGIGFLTTTGSPPARFMGGLNQEVGAAGGFVEQTPWSHYESDGYTTVRSHAADATLTGGLSDFLDPQIVDNGAGVQWDDHFERQNALPDGQTAIYQVGQKFIDTLGLTPPTDQKLTGERAVLTATVGDLSGNPSTNQTISYEVSGANNFSGQSKTGSDGQAKIAYVGGSPGSDTITAFIDSNGNGLRDAEEPQATATIDWQGPLPPVIGQSADVRVVKGAVRVKLPKRFSAGRAKAIGLEGAANSFVKVTEATQIPMGSTLDTRHGTVNLLSSATKRPGVGKFQSGDFNGGQFKVTQRKKNPLTKVSMRGGNLKGCNTRRPRGGAARKRGRRLFSRVHGRFRSRGRSSSATARGTAWKMTDSCKGTLTSVKSGTVTVHDFRLRKNKKVKAGKRYFARAAKLRRLKR